INFHRFGRLLFLLFLLVVRGFILGLALVSGGVLLLFFHAQLRFVFLFLFVVGLFLVFVLFFFLILLLAFVVIARGKRGGNVFAQRRGDELIGVGVDPCLVQVAVERIERPARNIKEVLAVRIEHGQIIIIITACHDLGFPLPGIVQCDGGMPILQVLWESDPTTIFRPAELQTA